MSVVEENSLTLEEQTKITETHLDLEKVVIPSEDVQETKEEVDNEEKLEGGDLFDVVQEDIVVQETDPESENITKSSMETSDVQKDSIEDVLSEDLQEEKANNEQEEETNIDSNLCELVSSDGIVKVQEIVVEMKDNEDLNETVKEEVQKEEVLESDIQLTVVETQTIENLNGVVNEQLQEQQEIEKEVKAVVEKVVERIVEEVIEEDVVVEQMDAESEIVPEISMETSSDQKHSNDAILSKEESQQEEVVQEEQEEEEVVVQDEQEVKDTGKEVVEQTVEEVTQEDVVVKQRDTESEIVPEISMERSSDQKNSNDAILSKEESQQEEVVQEEQEQQEEEQEEEEVVVQEEEEEVVQQQEVVIQEEQEGKETGKEVVEQTVEEVTQEDVVVEQMDTESEIVPEISMETSSNQKNSNDAILSKEESQQEEQRGQQAVQDKEEEINNDSNVRDRVPSDTKIEVQQTVVETKENEDLTVTINEQVQQQQQQQQQKQVHEQEIEIMIAGVDREHKEDSITLSETKDEEKDNEVTDAPEERFGTFVKLGHKKTIFGAESWLMRSFLLKGRILSYAANIDVLKGNKKGVINQIELHENCQCTVKQKDDPAYGNRFQTSKPSQTEFVGTVGKPNCVELQVPSFDNGSKKASNRFSLRTFYLQVPPGKSHDESFREADAWAHAISKNIELIKKKKI